MSRFNQFLAAVFLSTALNNGPALAGLSRFPLEEEPSVATNTDSPPSERAFMPSPQDVRLAQKMASCAATALFAAESGFPLPEGSDPKHIFTVLGAFSIATIGGPAVQSVATEQVRQYYDVEDDNSLRERIRTDIVACRELFTFASEIVVLENNAGSSGKPKNGMPTCKPDRELRI